MVRFFEFLVKLKIFKILIIAYVMSHPNTSMIPSNIVNLDFGLSKI